MGDYNMRKKLGITLVLLALFLFSSSSAAFASATDIVYTMPDGEKYHMKNCQYIKDGYTVMTLGVAYRNGYEPCKVCNPPTLTAHQIADLDKNIAEQRPFDASKLYEVDNSEVETLHQAVETNQNHDNNAISTEWLIVTAITLIILICICLYISNLKKQLREKDKKIHDLETELKILQANFDFISNAQKIKPYQTEELHE